MLPFDNAISSSAWARLCSTELAIFICINVTDTVSVIMASIFSEVSLPYFVDCVKDLFPQL